MVKKLTKEYINEFLNYIKTNPTLDDDYFISDEALDMFKLEDNVSYIQVEEGKFVGLMTILLKFGVRLRYAHVKDNDFDLLKALHMACLNDV